MTEGLEMRDSRVSGELRVSPVGCHRSQASSVERGTDIEHRDCIDTHMHHTYRNGRTSPHSAVQQDEHICQDLSSFLVFHSFMD